MQVPLKEKQFYLFHYKCPYISVLVFGKTEIMGVGSVCVCGGGEDRAPWNTWEAWVPWKSSSISSIVIDVFLEIFVLNLISCSEYRMKLLSKDEN